MDSSYNKNMKDKIKYEPVEATAETLMIYEYPRGGKTYVTPNAQIAAFRSDTGIYTSVTYHNNTTN
jgi:hypothetical protein